MIGTADLFFATIQYTDKWGRIDEVERTYEASDPDEVCGLIDRDFGYAKSCGSTYKIIRIWTV